MDWFQLLAVIFTFLGTVLSFVQVTSPKKLSRLATSFASSIKKRFPFLSLPAITSIGAGIIGSILAIAILTLVAYTFSSSTSQSSSKPPTPSQYSTYKSKTDVRDFTTTLTWDASAIVQQSMFIELDIQPNSNPSDITKLSNKFGPDYTFFIVAQLDTDSTTFTAEPKDQTQQPIDQGNFSFHWIATPLHSGSQAVDFVIKGIWLSQSNSNKQIEYYLGSHTWHIAVADNTQPIIIGQFNLSQILGGAGSVLVSVAFFQFVSTTAANRKQAKNQVAQPPQPPPTQPPLAQPPVSNQQNTQQPVP